MKKSVFLLLSLVLFACNLDKLLRPQNPTEKKGGEQKPVNPISPSSAINGLPVSDAKTLAENTALNTEIYDINAKIESGEADAGITYSLSPSSSPFQIDSNTGKLTLKSALDYETTTSYSLTLTATSQAQTSSNKSFTLTIQLSNVADINGLPTSDVNKTLKENYFTVGSEIYNVNAQIDSGAADAGITYSLSPSSSLFQIDSSTGKLTLTQSLVGKVGESYKLDIKMQATNNAALQAILKINIKIIAPKDFYLWLVKPDGTRLDTAFASTLIYAGYKYEAEIANPEILERYTDFEFGWGHHYAQRDIIERYENSKKNQSDDGKSHYTASRYPSAYIYVVIKYNNRLRILYTKNLMRRKILSSEELGIKWVNESFNSYTLDGGDARIKLGDRLSYDLSDWLNYTGLNEDQVRVLWRIPQGTGFYTFSGKTQNFTDSSYLRRKVELHIRPYRNLPAEDFWLESGVSISN